MSSGTVFKHTVDVQEMMAKTHFFKVKDFRNLNKSASSRNLRRFQIRGRYYRFSAPSLSSLLVSSSPAQHPGLTEQANGYCPKKMAAGKDPQVHALEIALGKAVVPRRLRKGPARKGFPV